MTEHRVQTLPEYSKHKQEKVDKIVECMKKHPYGINPKHISKETGVKHSTVRGLIGQISQVERIDYGLYHLDNSTGDGGSELHPEIKFHNLTLSCQTTYTGIEIKDNFGTDLINYMFGISGSGNVYVKVSTPYPISLSAIDSVFQTFKLKAKSYTFHADEITPDNTIVTSIEFNRDEDKVEVAGLTAVTVTRLIQTFKLYQKPNALRVEHKVTVPISLRTVFDMLLNKPDTSAIEDRMLKIEKQQERINQVLGQILYKLDTFK